MALLSNDQRSRLCRVEQDMAICSCMRMSRGSRPRMASKNHGQYFFASFSLLGRCFRTFGRMLVTRRGSWGYCTMHAHASCTKCDSHAPATNTADSPRRHQYVHQSLIKLGLNTAVQSAYTMPSTTGMAAAVTPAHHHLDI
jgi:hypothetical protein